MALIEDIVKGKLIGVAAVGATAMVLPSVFPYLAPSLRSAIKGGLSLFLESESEAEDGIIQRLADNALKSVLASLSESGSDADRREAASEAVQRFKVKAQARARRYGRDHHDRHQRKERHIATLRRKLEAARTRRTGRDATALDDLSAMLDGA